MRDTGPDLRLVTATLSRRGWLATQPNDFREALLTAVRIHRVPRGGAVYRQGDSADGLYGMVSGRVKFRTCTPDGREVVVGAVGPGGWFGEVSVFDGLPRVQDAIALNPSVVVCLPIDRFRAMTAENPRYIANFAEVMTRNMRGISHYHFEISPEPPPVRILRLLAVLLRDDFEQSPGNGVVLDVAQDLLASLAGLSRQTVNRELGKLSAAGAVECRYGRVVVHADRLRAVSE